MIFSIVFWLLYGRKVYPGPVLEINGDWASVNVAGLNLLIYMPYHYFGELEIVSAEYIHTCQCIEVALSVYDKL